MPNGPVFMRATPAMFSARAQAASVVTAGQPAARMTTTVSEARMATVAQPMALANPRLAMRLTRIRPHIVDVLGQGQEGDTRDNVTVPICPAAEPTDTLLFEDPADGSRKSYLPRYRLREQGGRYEIGVASAPDGTWRLSVGLERFPAPELGSGAQGAAELAHDIAVFFRYGAGPSNAIEKRVDFNEKTDDPKGVTLSVGLSLGERDNLLFALQTPAARPALVVRRAIRVATRIAANTSAPPPPMLVAAPNLAMMATIQPMAVAAAQPVPAPPPAVAPAVMMARPQMMRLSRPLAMEVVTDVRFDRPVDTTPPPPADRYRTIERALDDVADPEPFVLDPRLHPYLYDGAAVGGGGAKVSEFRRIVLAYPKGAADARFHAYLQDKGEPSVFYYLPDSFKLARRDVAPYLPQMVVRIAAPDGGLQSAAVTVDYVVEPFVDAERLEAAAAALKAEIPAATSARTEPELRPLQARASLKMWIPGAAGAALSDQKDVAIDLANGYLHSLTLPLDGFRQLYAAAYSRDATSLFSGQVLVETGLSTPEPVPVEIRFARTQGEILSFGEQPSDSDGTIAVRMKNDIESTVRLTSLPVTVRKGDQEVPAGIEGISFDVPIELVPGGELSFTVRPGGVLAGDGIMDAIFDTAPVEIIPDPEKILPLISDTSVPAQYTRQIDVMTMPELLGDAADPNGIILINVEFRGGGSLKLSRDQAQGTAQVQLPLMDLLLGRDTQGKYGFRQQIIRRNGSQSVDPGWREADFSLLVLPIV
jgi:hypothetical protein